MYNDRKKIHRFDNNSPKLQIIRFFKNYENISLKNLDYNKQQEFCNELNHLITQISSKEKASHSIATFLLKKFTDLISHGDYYFDLLIENLITIGQEIRPDNWDFSSIYYPMLYETLQGKTQIKKSIISDTMESKESLMFSQLSNIYDPTMNMNEKIKCFTLFKSILNKMAIATKKKHRNFLKNIAKKASDRLWGNYSLAMIFIFINIKLWSNTMYNAGHDLKNEYLLLGHMYHQKKKKFFANFAEIIISKISKISDNFSERDVVYAMLYNLLHTSIQVQVLIPVVIQSVTSQLLKLEYIDFQKLISGLLKLTSKRNIKSNGNTNNNESSNPDLYYDLLFNTFLNLIFVIINQYPQAYLLIISCLQLFSEKIPNDGILSIAFKNFPQVLHSSMIKKVYFKDFKNLPVFLCPSKDIQIIKKEINDFYEKSKQLTLQPFDNWNFLYWLSKKDSKGISYIIIKTMDNYNDNTNSNIKNWLEKIYKFDAFKKLIIMDYLNLKIKSIKYILHKEFNIMLNLLKILEPIVDFLSNKQDTYLLKYLFTIFCKILYNSLIILRKQSSYEITSFLDNLLNLMIKCSSSKNNHKIPHTILNHIDNIVYKKICRLLIEQLQYMDQSNPLFLSLFKIIFLLFATSERRFIILINEIFTIMNFQINMWKYPKIIIRDIDENISQNLDKHHSIKDELLRRLRLKETNKIDFIDKEAYPERMSHLVDRIILLLKYCCGINKKNNMINENISLENFGFPPKVAKDMNLNCLNFIKKSVEWFLVELNPEKTYGISLPRYDYSPYNIFIRQKIIENLFTLKIIKLILEQTDAPGVYELVISILINLISIYHDKKLNEKPHKTTKFLLKILAKKDIIPVGFATLAVIIEKINSSSTSDLLMMIFNFIMQFKTIGSKNASKIDKQNLIEYRRNLKIIFLDEIKQICDIYPSIMQIFG